MDDFSSLSESAKAKNHTCVLPQFALALITAICFISQHTELMPRPSKFLTPVVVMHEEVCWIWASFYMKSCAVILTFPEDCVQCSCVLFLNLCLETISC